ncbi:hypothetical protein OZX67_04585 [Bifidobacterium sp. ESL0728]|uniref:sugar-binding transcriptional regulator n=1 Tax=Bifidobacterium sp. ESL0728 TaxID=2983220 RepID=UPI0023F74150|nr:sugar-binding domain-containing protein [Bifidobacterium sp. ESL0728]WEV59812.1 hypothetical protein OZX67_04585 [Bifidobacterium sp. ESL0728]
MDDRQQEDNALLGEIARRFYICDETKSEIASSLELSRFKVARLIAEARNKGVVSIQIHDDSPTSPELSQHLRQHLGLKQVIIVPSSHDISVERDLLGEAGAKYLMEHIHEGESIGFSWGRTLLPIARHISNLPRATFVQLTGVVGNDPSQSPIAILNQMTIGSGSSAKALFAPLFSPTSTSAMVTKMEPAVAETLSYYSKLDMAFLSIGSWNPRVTQLEQHISPEDAEKLNKMGAIAECGGMFFDEFGNYLNLPINERRISINVEELRNTPIVVFLAGGKEKSNAIRAICLSGLATCLITTDTVAQILLKEPPIHKNPQTD